MNRTHVGIISFIIIIIAGIGIFHFSQTPVKQQIKAPNSPSATALMNAAENAMLMVESGTVVVTHGKESNSVTSEMTVHIGDEIKTDSTSQATIIFPDNDILRLDYNTTITLTQLIATDTNSTVLLTQTRGNSWSHVEPLLDRQRHYSVETPTLVATVRGTVFNVNIDNPQNTWVGVHASHVNVHRKNDNSDIIVDPNQFVAVNNQVKATMSNKIMGSDKLGSNWFLYNLKLDEYMSQKLKEKGITKLQRHFMRDNRSWLFLRSLKLINDKPLLKGPIISSLPTVQPTILKPTTSSTSTSTVNPTAPSSTPLTTIAPTKTASATPTYNPTTQATTSPRPTVSTSPTSTTLSTFIPIYNFTNYRMTLLTPTASPSPTPYQEVIR